MFDVNKDSDFRNLITAIEAARTDLKPFRETYSDYVTQMVGVYYSDKSDQKAQPVNLLELATTVYCMKLMSTPPRVHSSTFNARVRPAGVKMAQVVNDKLSESSEAYRAMNRAVRTSIGSLGVVKVGVISKGSTDIQGYPVYNLEPFVRHVLLDDWVQDMSAVAIGEWQFCGHRYEMELDEALNNPDFDEEVRKQLSECEKKTTNQDGDERISTIQGTKTLKAAMKKMVTLWEIYLPKEQQVVTLSLEYTTKPLRVQPWTGPRRGPYHVLFFAEVDGNSMPQSPSQLWMGLHQIVNRLYRKLDRQSERQKTNTLVNASDAEDGGRITDAKDGEAIVVQNVAAAHEVSMGGISQTNFAFMLQSKDLFSWLAGNLDVLGGLGPGSDTVGQDKMLEGSSSQRIKQMQNQVLLFAKGVLTDFGWYMWNDPMQTYPVTMQIPGYGPMPAQLTPQERTHDFYEHEFEIEPYSMQLLTPQERLMKLQQILTQVVFPLLPTMQQQGLGVDFAAVMNLIGEYSQMPELAEVITRNGAPLDAETAKGPPQGTGRPPATERTNIRVSQPGKSNTENRDGALIQKMMGGNLQPAEAAGAM